MTTQERLARLERTNRKLTLAMIAAGLAGAMVVTAGMAPIEPVVQEVRARKFTLVDEIGRVRASLWMNNSGPAFQLVDENGRPRTTLVVDKDGPTFQLVDENSRPRTTMGVTKDGPILQLVDRNLKPRTQLVVDEDGPSFLLIDEKGNPRTSMAVTKEDGGWLQILDENGQAVRELP